MTVLNIAHKVIILELYHFQQLVTHKSIMMIDGVNFEQQPPTSNKLLHYNMARSDNNRVVCKPSVKHKSLSAKTNNSFLHRAINIYNRLPDYICTLYKKKSSKQSNQYFKLNFNPKSIPKTNDND